MINIMGNDSPTMNNIQFFSDFAHGISTIENLNEPTDLLIDLIRQTVASSGRVLIFANGGSAAIASHIAVDFTKTCNVPTMVFHDSAMLTCFANDFGYEHTYEKIVNYFANSNDLVILISSSGESNNLINAAEVCRSLGLKVFTLTGFKSTNRLRTENKFGFWVESVNYNYVEAMHLVFLLNICEFLRKVI